MNTAIAARTMRGSEDTIDPDALATLDAKLDGDVLQEGDPGYQEARTIWNAMIDRHPAMIVRCAGTPDVVDAVRFVREHGLAFSVKGAGHNIAGHALCDGGVTIDLSGMKGIHVDPRRCTARAQPGVTWGELDRATELHGLVTPGGIVSTTGTAGFTLGGGFGYLTRMYGYTCDNLVSAEVVTADGRVVHASDTQDPELMWGLRGGGGNFGIVTSFEYRLHPLAHRPLAGMVLYSMDDAERVLKGYRDVVAEAPEALGSLALLRLAPPAPFLPEELHGAPVVGVVVCWAGPEEEGRELVAPLRELATPLADVIAPKPYTVHQKMLDGAQPAGRQQYWKSDYLTGLEDDAIAEAARHARRITSPHSAVLIMHLEGEGNRVPVDATAYPHRDTRFVLNIAAQWTDPHESERHMAWARTFWEAMRPYASGGTYGNFLNPDDGEDRVRQAFGDNYPRLARLKARFDPDNAFRINQNVEPARG